MQDIFNDIGGHDLNWILTHLGSASNPDWKEAMKQYGSATGLDGNQRYPGYNAFRYLFPALFARDADQLAYSTSLQPVAHNATNAALAGMLDPDKASAEYIARTNAGVGSATTALLNRLKSLGAGSGAMEGAALNVSNNAATAGNQFRAQQDSSAGRRQRLMDIMSTITGQQPHFEDELNLHGGMVGTPRNQTGAQIGGNLLGSFLSTPGLFGGMGGGGGGTGGSSVGSGIGNGLAGLF